jgi:uncharacterized protein YndB with AHSA1/START domain
MAHEFQIEKDLEVGASPEQVWEAITTGPGLDSWFMGRNDVEPREGGTVRWSIGGYTEESTVTTWDPPTRFVNTGSASPDGVFHQFDYRIEERLGGSSAIRYVHSGMLGEDWEAEYDAMSEGDPMYLHKLVQYLTYFGGRFAMSVDAQGPQVPDRGHAMKGFRRGLGLSGGIAVGDRVLLTPEGPEAIDGVVDYDSPHFLGVRSDDALYRFIHGFDGTVMVGHHLFADGVDRQEAERAWGSWLARLFEPSGGGASASDG